ncbi:hypothetical protein BS78_02G046100 [Paspalum vaginatum]|nr:hypothetical protein BS78_02G046100 [Paspalum vaginatum]
MHARAQITMADSAGDVTAAAASAPKPAVSAHQPLAGRVAIVTGASRGIGRAITAHLSSLGASVVLGYASRADKADELAASLPRAVAVKADVSDEAGVRSLFDAAESAFGAAAHILVANAGVLDARYPSVGDTSTKSFDRIVDREPARRVPVPARGGQPAAPRRRGSHRGSDVVGGGELPDGERRLHGVQGGRGGDGADDGEGAQGHPRHGQLRRAGAHGHGHVLRWEGE